MAIGVFIDGAHLSICWNRIAPGRQIDFLRLRSQLEAELNDDIVEAYCFDAIEDGAPTSRFRAMEHAGFRVKLYSYSFEPLYDGERRPLIDPTTQRQAQRKIQKGVDVGLVIHMLDSFHRRQWEKLVLVASDADFAEPIQRLVEHHNVELTTLGIPSRTSHAIVPYAMRRLDLAELAPQITRDVINLRAS
jgi:uncharacterized LabA/DUF88 family protein